MPRTTQIAGEEVYRIEEGGPSRDERLYFLYNKGKTLNDEPVRVLGNRVDAKGVFSDRELRVALALGHVVCDPEPLNIANSSIDTTIGHYFYRTGVDDHGPNSIYNPFDEASSREYFGEVQEAEPAGQVIARLGQSAIHNATLDALSAYPENHPVIALAPRERILAHTTEFIGVRSPGTSSMQSRSTTGRNGWASCLCAGWGDSGYINRWTMEVYNFNDRHVLIPEGYRMAQISVFATGPVSNEYAKLTGKYQTSGASNLVDLKKTWRPEMILPRAYKDKIAPIRIVEGLAEGIK